jgi:hypothetical protein
MEKDQVTSRADQLKKRSDSLLEKNGALAKSLVQSNWRVSMKEKEVSASHEAADNATKKVDEMVDTKKKDDSQIRNLQSRADQLEREKNELNTKISLLMESNNRLNNLLVSAKDNILLESFSKNGKLNLKGKKIRKLVATLSMPFELKKPAFKFFDLHGNQLSGQYGTFDFRSSTDANSTFGSGKPTRAELVYSLSKKLGPGTYRIEMLDSSKHIGNLLVSFR